MLFARLQADLLAKCLGQAAFLTGELVFTSFFFLDVVARICILRVKFWKERRHRHAFCYRASDTPGATGFVSISGFPPMADANGEC